LALQLALQPLQSLETPPSLSMLLMVSSMDASTVAPSLVVLPPWLPPVQQFLPHDQSLLDATLPQPHSMLLMVSLTAGSSDVPSFPPASTAPPLSKHLHRLTSAYTPQRTFAFFYGSETVERRITSSLISLNIFS
jgi:hypothetical protein